MDGRGGSDTGRSPGPARQRPVYDLGPPASDLDRKSRGGCALFFPRWKETWNNDIIILCSEIIQKR
jgi:hypothetical protein